jgi:GLPGLI family protein
MEYFRQEIYIVQIGDKLTKGFTYQKFYLDSLQKSSPELYRQRFSASVKESIEAMRRTGDLSYVRNNFFTVGGFPSDLYKDYRKKEIRVRDNINIYNFVYKDELKPQDWEILSDTTTILGYHCQKAQCSWRGRDWTAWFTTEIPVSEGPWKFYGLPGLITKLHDTQNHYSFVLISFQETEEPIDIKLPKGTQKIERKEFIRASFGEKGEMINKAEMAKVGLSNDRPVKSNYDYIERDYK